MSRTMTDVGSIGPRLDAIERAYRAFESAVEGPEKSDYASDEEACDMLEQRAENLRAALNVLLTSLVARADKEQP